MKKTNAVLIFSIVLSFILMIFAAADNSFESSEIIDNEDIKTNFSISVDATEKEVYVGDKFEIIIKISNIDDDFGLIAMQTELQYDANFFSCTNATISFPAVWKGDNDFVYDINRDTNGNETGLLALMSANDGVPGRGVTNDDELYFTVTFEVVEAVFDNFEFKCLTGEQTIGVNDLNNTIYGKGDGAIVTVRLDNSMKYLITAASVLIIVMVGVILIYFKLKTKRKK